MPLVNFDNLEVLKEPVEFVVRGKKYTVVDFSSKRIQEATDMSELYGDLGPEILHAKQLAHLTGAPEEDFMGLNDVRVTAAMIQYIMSSAEDVSQAMRVQKKRKR